MTNLDKIKSRVKHDKLNDNDYASYLEDRGLVSTDTFDVSTNSKALDLTQADMLKALVTFSDMSEGGYKISQSQKDLYLKIASGIYSKWGEADPSAPTVRFVSMG